MEAKARLENIDIVLKGPKYAANIGFVARCAKNMGMEKIVVINGNLTAKEEIKKTSTHFAAELVDQICFADDLEKTLGHYGYIVGTTARLGAARGPVIMPHAAARDIVEVSQNNRVALLFGPEDTGLSNTELKLCHALVTIPTSERFKSINLSHAVMIICYEIFTASREDVGTFTPRLASAAEIEGMYAQLQPLLTKIGFINPQNPEHWMRHIRRLFSRTRLFSRDVKIIRGICRQLEWYLKHHGKDTPGT